VLVAERHVFDFYLAAWIDSVTVARRSPFVEEMTQLLFEVESNSFSVHCSALFLFEPSPQPSLNLAEVCLWLHLKFP